MSRRRIYKRNVALQEGGDFEKEREREREK